MAGSDFGKFSACRCNLEVEGGEIILLAAHGAKAPPFLESQSRWVPPQFSGIVYCILKGLHPDSAAVTIDALSNLANYEKCNPAERFIFQQIVAGLVQTPAPPQRKLTVINGGIA